MFALFWPDLESVSPVATLISSLFTAAIAGGLYALFRRWRGRSERFSRSLEALIAFLRSTDRALVRYGSWWVGTRVSSPWPRRGTTLGVFIFIAVCGALLPWPWCLWALSLGLLNVFIVFRHWSHDEKETKSRIGPDDKQIRIDDDLSAEMTGAFAFVLVYATTSFAQIQAARQGFQMPPDAGAFTFLRYALVEGLKLAPLVPYSDLFADSLQELGAGAAASFSAKSAVLAFRAALVLIILAALKRFIDSARHAAERVVLRPILAVSDNPDADQTAVQQAVGKLATLATRGDRAAAERLEQIITEVRERKPRYSAKSGSPPPMVLFPTRSRVRSPASCWWRSKAIASSPMRTGLASARRSIGSPPSTLSALRCARSANGTAARRASNKPLRSCARP